ncbi:calcium/sodium antiporter, partial [Candidatus Peregrinibacteria bacterium]|nr:calcium/sodium antiporter [Candidatus Peregrinibacteria bacterium]
MFSIWTIIFLLFGFFLLIKSADYLIDGAAGLAKQAKIPKIVIGLSLVAFGTSAPEFTVSLISAVQGSSDIGLGNVIGSNIANIALVLAVAAMFKNVPVTKSTLTRGIPLSFLAMFALLVLGYDVWFHGADVGQNFLTLGDGLIFLSFFIIFVYYVYGDLKSTQIQEEEIKRIERKWYQKKWWYLALLVGGGLLGLIIGGKLIVDNAVITANFFGVSEALIGLTIIAMGTSLPELAIVVVAAMKHENDLAVGSIIGSSIFNIFLVLG